MLEKVSTRRKEAFRPYTVQVFAVPAERGS